MLCQAFILWLLDFEGGNGEASPGEDAKRVEVWVLTEQWVLPPDMVAFRCYNIWSCCADYININPFVMKMNLRQPTVDNKEDVFKVSLMMCPIQDQILAPKTQFPALKT